MQTVFGSGWAWLVLDTTSGKPVLKVVATPNQDNPSFTEGVHLLLGLDVRCAFLPACVHVFLARARMRVHVHTCACKLLSLCH
ncbi:hypothetical protein EON67_01060 [archaeon]|nr:MAG: hypothetical protein EON67_01060 [archaeon]